MQKVDISKIICGYCKENNKAKTFNNTFFKCNKCKIKLCPLCRNKHDQNHNVINYDDKDYLCDLHNEKFSSYCEKCEKNICIYCKEHTTHQLIDFKEIIPDLDKEAIVIEELRVKIDKIKSIIDNLINRLKTVKGNFEYYYDINYNTLLLITEKKINYDILYNFNKIKNQDIENTIDNIIKIKDFNDAFQKLNETYYKMTSKFHETITINYKKENNPTIKIFGSEFVKNNKNFSKILIKSKEYDLTDKISIDNNNPNNPIFEIQLKGIQNMTNISHMFSGCSSLDKLPDISRWNTTNITNMSYLFYKCSSNKIFNAIKEWNTINVKYMDYAFSECIELLSLPDISTWNTENVESMAYIFSGCTKLKSLPNISKWNTAKTKKMSGMFSECHSLEYLPDISNWNTSNVKRMNKMFLGSKNLIKLPDLSKWNTNNIEDINSLFSGCSSIQSLPDISNWNIEKVKNMCNLFHKCSSIKILPDLSKWNTSNVDNMNYLFHECSSLKYLPDISN